MFEAIVGGIHGHRAEAHAEGEERLRDGGVPNRWLQDLVPRRLEEKDDTVHGSLQRYRSHQKADHDDVWEKCQEISRLTGALHTLADHYVDEYPAD